MALPPGARLGPYEVTAQIGAGGMGEVYRARDPRLNRNIAIKILPAVFASDPSHIERFRREARAVAALTHPNIVTIHSVEEADGVIFLTMELVEGWPLESEIAMARLDLDRVLDLASAIADALTAAHEKGIIHRDLKPANVMIDVDGRVRVLDFGLAKVAGIEAVDGAETKVELTNVGAVMGTMPYMSPEQVQGRPVDARTDIFSFGVVLYEMATGTRPFVGDSWSTLIASILRDVPRPIAEVRPELPHQLGRLIGACLEKQPNDRIQTAREVRNELRALQRESATASPPADAQARDRTPSVGRRTSRRWWTSRTAAGTAAALAAVVVGAPLWMLKPVERVPVAVAPVGNQTGYAELDPYRLALTRELVAQLSDSSLIRVLPYERLTAIVRPFRQGGDDISSREALQALTTHSGAQIIIIPTLLYENGAWRARVELRDAGTATNQATYAVDGIVSTSMKEAAYGLVPPLASRIVDHFNDAAPRRIAIANGIRKIAGRAPAPPVPNFRTLDVAAEFEQGLNAYEQQEYATALGFFTAASERDERNPILMSWRSHAARLMRRDDEALEAAEEAARLLSNQTRRRDRLLIEAVVAEARRNVQVAEARYRELVAAFPDEPGWVMELAAFQNRLATADATTQAIGNYIDALGLDNRLTRADLELCRLYGPTRQNERVRARDHGQRSLATSRVTGDRNGEAHALLCLMEVLRVGGDEDRRESQRNAEMSRQIFADLGSKYNLPRAELGVALGAGAQGNTPEAAAMFAQALQSARRGGNGILEPLLLMNLGVAQVNLGNRAEGANYYQASSRLYEALGDQGRAAQQAANSAALRIEHGDQPEEPLRDVQNALAVFQKLGDKTFEAFCLQVIAAYYRHVGRHADAERELNRALAILRERNIEDSIGSVNMDRARSHIEIGNYGTASDLLHEVLGDGTGPDAAGARIHLARVQAGLGDLLGADAELAKASSAVGAEGDLFPLLHLVEGEVAYAAGRLTEGRAAFNRAASLWTGSLPDAASVEAAAYLGLIDALGGRPAGGRVQVQSSLEQAERMGRAALAARCRLFLAQIHLHERSPGDALRTLNEIAADEAGRTIGAELRAQVHYWRSQALIGLGDRAAAEAETRAARKIVEEIRAALDQADRQGFATRPDVKRIIG